MAGVRFEAVVKRFEGGITALDNFDLEVADGEALAIVGPSGSGKTTALRIAAGLESATSGRIHLGGRDVSALAPAARNVSMVFQSYALFPHLDVASNIGFGLIVRKVPRTDAAQLVRWAADLVGCADLLDRRPHQLSGGERQRVALARALVRRPDAFLLDEPLSNLDAQSRATMRTELQRLHQRVATTMIHVTHDQGEAMALGDRVAVVADGRVLQVATPHDVYWRPVNRFVATFVGTPTINLLPARAVGPSRLEAGAFIIDLDGPRDALPAGPLEVGVRPEHVLVGPTAAANPGAVAGEIELTEIAGADAYLHVTTPAGRLIVRVDGQRPPRPGATIPVAIDPTRCYVFAPGSGETLHHARAEASAAS